MKKTERLDKKLAENNEFSRSQIQKMIKGGLVSINGETITTPHFFVSDDDKIEVKKNNTEKIKTKIPDLNILFEDDNIIIFEKPSGLMVHEAPGKTEPTVVDALVKHCPKIKKVGDNPTRPGIVHRLDKLASGVMVAAKNQDAFEFLKKQFSDRNVKKEYLVLVYGAPAQDTGTVSFKLARSKTKGRMVAKPETSEDGREAITHYEIIKKLKTTTLLRVHIETGRTHQIRAHMRALNLPVVGDPLYKKTRMKNIKPIPLPRLFLHAHKLTLPLPNGETKTFVSPLPNELKEILK
jgi:23S rRNA pseudouridine1911/1915/1917 synthase